MKETTPKGIYLVAVPFSIGGMICMVQLVNLILAGLGVDTRLNLFTLNWVLPAYVFALGLVLVGVALLARLHPLAVWSMFVITLVLGAQLATTPPVSPFYSASRIYLNRLLVMLPMMASCVYLWRVRARRA